MGRRRSSSSSRDVWREYVADKHSLPGGLKTVFLDELFNDQVYEVGPISHLNAGIMTADLALLRGLSSLFNDCSYFEISGRRSESLVNMATIANECYALIRPAMEMRRKGIRHKYMYLMGSFIKAFDNVVVLTGDSRTYDFTSLKRKFDLIFINSGQDYDDVLVDTHKTFEYLLHDESIAVWHDYSYFPEQVRFEVLAGILDGTDPALREQLFFVSKTKCAILLPSKYQHLG
jgi:hypothetical protein